MKNVFRGDLQKCKCLNKTEQHCSPKIEIHIDSVQIVAGHTLEQPHQELEDSLEQEQQVRVLQQVLDGPLQQEQFR